VNAKRLNQASLAFLSAVLCLLATSIQGAEFDTTIPMDRRNTQTYYIQGVIHGFGGVDLMVDTGAGYMTINEATLAVLRQKGNVEYVKELTGKMADGTRRTIPVYRLSKLTLGNDCVLRNVEAAVLPRKTRLILGLSALEKAAPFVFSIDPPSLALSNCVSL